MTSARIAALTDRTLIHTCAISTRAQSAPSGVPAFDDYGEAVADTYGPPTTGVPCFARRQTGPGEVDEPGRRLVAAGWQVRLGRDQAIGPDDQIADVRERPTEEGGEGALIVAGPLSITDLIPRAGHVLAVCQAAALAGPTEVEE